MRKKFIILTMLLSFLVRFWELGSNPPSLNWDEVAFAWNGYSILQTGKDEYGSAFPFFFRSFDDAKHPTYVYLTAASIAIFGKNDFSVRFTSAFFGVLTVLVLFLTLEQMVLLRKKNTTLDPQWANRSANMAALGAFFFAISPWHIHFSRVAFEANLGLFFATLGAYLFLKFNNTNTKTILIVASAISLSLAIYTYVSYRLLIPLLLIGWVIYLKESLIKNFKKYMIAIAVGVILCGVIAVNMAQGVGLERYQATSIFYRTDILERNKQLAKEDFDNGEGPLSVIVHNFRIPLTTRIIDSFFSHFQFSFLFTRADLPRHQVPGFGLLYIWQLPLILIGIVYLIKNSKNLNAPLTLWWLFVAVTPSAITWPAPHSIRSLNMLPPLSFLTGIGLWVVIKLLQIQDLKSYHTAASLNSINKVKSLFLWAYPKISLVAIFSLIIFSVVTFLIAYKNFLPAEYSKYWLYGRKEMVQYVESQKDRYNNITVALSLDWAYLWFLWYGNYSPESYLSQGGTVGGGFAETQNTIGKIKFKPFEFTPDQFGNKALPENSLYIGSPEDFPKSVVPEKIIYDLSGEPIIYIVKT
jgi:4-amino-4-deoxy-L-arabinose transferase-like glycosyltransferase